MNDSNCNRAVSRDLKAAMSKVDLVFEVNTIYQSIPEENGVKIDNHGGTKVFLSPGMRMTFNERVVFNLSAGFPVIEVLGEQGGSAFRVSAGIATSFGG